MAYRVAALRLAVGLEIRYAHRAEHFIIERELPGVLSCRFIQYGVGGIRHDGRRPRLLEHDFTAQRVLDRRRRGHAM